MNLRSLQRNARCGLRHWTDLRLRVLPLAAERTLGAIGNLASGGVAALGTDQSTAMGLARAGSIHLALGSLRASHHHGERYTHF